MSYSKPLANQEQMRPIQMRAGTTFVAVKPGSKSRRASIDFPFKQQQTLPISPPLLFAGSSLIRLAACATFTQIGT
jgi:hypothetical protein